MYVTRLQDSAALKEFKYRSQNDLEHSGGKDMPRPCDVLSWRAELGEEVGPWANSLLA